MAYARTAAKKIADRAVGADMGRAPPRRRVLMRENAFRARQRGRLRIPLARLVLVHLILACRRRIDFEAGVRDHPQLPVNVRDARSLAKNI